MKKILIVIFLIFVLVGTSCLQPKKEEVLEDERISEGDHWAVIIGVSDYENISKEVHGVANAEGVFRQLESVWGKDHIKLLVDTEATKENIEKAISDWLDPRESKGDTVLFFYSGHGEKENLYTYESTYNPKSWISSYELDEWLDALESKETIVILDTCNSFSFIDNLSQGGRVILICSAEDEICWWYCWDSLIWEDLWGEEDCYSVFSFLIIWSLSHW